MLVGATAYRMLHGWPPNAFAPGDAVLVWGGAGGLGSMAIQIARPRAASRSRSSRATTRSSTARSSARVGAINRKFDHWGMLPHWKDDAEYGEVAQGRARVRRGVLGGARRAARARAIVFEHPGEDTVPTSFFVCDTGGMVVICAGTTGYNATLDLRYHWMRQKRFQGSHFANDEQAKGVNDLVIAGKVDPCLSRVFRFAETGACHQLMRENRTRTATWRSSSVPHERD